MNRGRVPDKNLLKTKSLRLYNFSQKDQKQNTVNVKERKERKGREKTTLTNTESC